MPPAEAEEANADPDSDDEASVGHDDDDDDEVADGSSFALLLGLILSCKLVCRPGTRMRRTSVRSRTMFLSWVMMMIIMIIIMLSSAPPSPSSWSSSFDLVCLL